MQDALQMISYFWQDKPRVIAFVVCCALVLLLACITKEDPWKKMVRYILLPSFLLLALLLNPVVSHILVTKDMTGRTVRFFWLIPVTLLLAIVPVQLISKLPGKITKALAGVLLPVVIFMAFNNGMTTFKYVTWIRGDFNIYKTPQVALDLCDAIMEDDTYSEKTVVAPDVVGGWFRQYQPAIYLPFSRGDVDRSNPVNMELYKTVIAYDLNSKSGNPIDVQKLAQKSKEGGYNYIILPTDALVTGNLEDYGYEKAKSVSSYYPSDFYSNVYGIEYTIYRRAEGVSE